jgi:glycosyltransferase involved in cell wall biosynthesis
VETEPDKQNICLITAFGPGTANGGALVTQEILNTIKRDGCAVKIYTFSKANHSEIKKITVIPTTLARRLLGIALFPLLHPLFTGRLSIRVLREIHRLAKSDDVVVLNFSQVFLYSIFLRRKNFIIICHDIVYQNYRRRRSRLSRISARWIYLSEQLVLRLCKGRIFCLSHKDARFLQIAYKQNAGVIDWGVSDLVKRTQLMSTQPISINIKRERFFCLFGAWQREENSAGLKWFLDAVVDKMDPGIKIYVIGSGISAELRQSLSKDPRIVVHGFVENPYPIIRLSLGLIAPLFTGAGIKIKCLEALACGVPVIGTHIALEGLQGLCDGRFLLCHDGTDFLSALELLSGTKSKPIDGKKFENSAQINLRANPERRGLDWSSIKQQLHLKANSN